jgi:hypothetical protein
MQKHRKIGLIAMSLSGKEFLYLYTVGTAPTLASQGKFYPHERKEMEKMIALV